jgi:hypothetical protein
LHLSLLSTLYYYCTVHFGFWVKLRENSDAKEK